MGCRGVIRTRESCKEGCSYREVEEGRGNSRKEARTWARYTCSTSPSSPLSAYRHPTRILRSATHSIPRLNYSLPPLVQLHARDDPDLESLIPPISAASSDCEYRPRTSTAHPAPEEISNTPQLGKPLPRRLRSS